MPHQPHNLLLMPYLKLFVKVFFSTLLVVVLACAGVFAYVVINQQKIADGFVQHLKSENNIPLEYSKLDFSVTKNFPLASVVLSDVCVVYPGNSADTLVSLNELLISANVLQLINGNYLVNSIGLNGGSVNYNQSLIGLITSRFENQSASDSGSARNFRFDNINIEDVNVSYRSNSQSAPVDVRIARAKIQFDFTPQQLNLQFKTELQNIIPKSIKCDKTLFVEGAVTSQQKQWQIDALNLKLGPLQVFSNGSYNANNKQVNLRFITPKFGLKRVAQMFGIDEITAGTTSLKGSLLFNTNSGTVEVLAINHSSTNILAKVSNIEFKCPTLVAQTKLSNNFSRHFTQVSKFEIVSDENRIWGSAKVKGFKNLALLCNSNFQLDSISKLGLLPKIEIKTNGSVKLLAGIKIHEKSANFNVLQIAGNAQFESERNLIFNPVKNLSGEVHVDKNINLKVNGILHSSDFASQLIVHNTLNVINKSEINSIKASVSSSFVDVDKLLDDIAKIEMGENSSSSKLSYSINFKADTINLFDKQVANVSGLLYEQHDTLHLQNLRAGLYSGMFNGNVQIHQNSYNIDGKLKGVDVSQLFFDNNNFSQNFIKHSDISGILDANFKLKMADINGKIDRESLLLDGYFKLVNGKLKGMNRVKQLEKWLNLNEVESIDFSTIQNQILIHNKQLIIPSMDINSNVMNISLDGKHSFDGDFEYHTKLNLTRLLANRFMNSSASTDYDYDEHNNRHINLLIFGNSSDYKIKRDRERANQKFKDNVKAEGQVLKNILNEEFKIKKDSLKTPVDTSHSNTGFRIEWDDE